MLSAPEVRDGILREVVMNQPHSKYAHLYVVLRLDPDMIEPEHQIAVTKVFRSELDANEEVERLNALNGGKGARYLMRVGRLIESADV